MKFEVGCDLEEFIGYYRTLDDLHTRNRIAGLADVKFGELGPVEERIIRMERAHVIVWRDNAEILGHAIWHETKVDEHRKGDSREKEDTFMLEKLLGGTRHNIIELHEVWLETEHRRKGYGKKFFEFFESFARQRGYDSIIYYADDPAAIAICRSRQYREGFLAKEKWHVFCRIL